MKTDHYFAPYLNTKGYLIINGIGHFRLLKDGQENTAVDVIRKSLGQKSSRRIHFEYDPDIVIDNKLVDFLHEATHGDCKVIQYNLQSYTGLTYEMLKLGFEVELSGIGYLRLDKNTHQVAFSAYGESGHNAMHISKASSVELHPEEAPRGLPALSFNRIMKKITDYMS